VFPLRSEAVYLAASDGLFNADDGGVHVPHVLEVREDERLAHVEACIIWGLGVSGVGFRVDPWAISW